MLELATKEEIEKIVALTMITLEEDCDVDLSTTLPTKVIAAKVYDELNTVSKPPIRVKVLAVGLEHVIVMFEEDIPLKRVKGMREDIPLKYCYDDVKDGDHCWAQYRSNPSWGRWYLLGYVNV